MFKFASPYLNRTIGVTALLAFSSGLPLPLTTGTLQAWMASEQVDLIKIGLFSLVGLPYTVKFLWAPLMDRFSPPFLGRRTGWIAIFQILLILGIGAMGFCSPSHSSGLLATAALTVAFFSASQDIVIDAYRTDLLSAQQRGIGVAVTVTGVRIALLISGALALVLSDHLSWKEVYLLMAGLMMLGLVVSFFSPTPQVSIKPPQSLSEAVIAPFVNYFQRPGAMELLLFIILYKLADALAGIMTTPFLIQLGFTRTAIGTVNKGFGMIVTIIGGFVGGGLVTKFGIKRCLWIFGLLQGISNLVFFALAQMGQNYSMMMVAIGIENVCGGMGTTAFVAFLMSLCDKRFTATQYALLSSVMALTRTAIAGPFSGILAKACGWPLFFLMSTLFAIPGLYLLTLKNLWKDYETVAEQNQGY